MSLAWDRSSINDPGTPDVLLVHTANIRICSTNDQGLITFTNPLLHNATYISHWAAMQHSEGYVERTFAVLGLNIFGFQLDHVGCSRAFVQVGLQFLESIAVPLRFPADLRNQQSGLIDVAHDTTLPSGVFFTNPVMP